MQASSGNGPDLAIESSPVNHEAPSAMRRGSALIYGLTIFASAFLLFQVQPLIAKIILPWFGGAAAVWIVCLVFFQAELLLGYFYAHVLTRKFSPEKQFRIHAAILMASLLTLPILPKNSWRPTSPDNPALHILLLLTVTVGLPYFLLSSTSPLLQAWYSQSRNGAAPYRFYALSNIGSLLALLSYPILVEPHVSSSHQAMGWSSGYVAVVLLLGALAFSMRKRTAPGSFAVEGKGTAGVHPDWKMRCLWVVLAACGSALLLAVTNHVTQNIASVPFLWVIPLCLYLFSFILCFDGDIWYRRNFFLRMLGVSLGGMTYALSPSFTGLPIKVLIPLYCIGLFVCCMFCHGELARLKPEPAYLTTFYLMCSLGGVLGAAFVALLAPHLFSGYYELQVSLGTCAIMVLVANRRDPQSPFYKARRQPAWLVIMALVIAIVASLFVTVQEQAAGAQLTVRNFYGVLRVVNESGKETTSGRAKLAQPDEPTVPYRVLMNGTIKHGLEFLVAQREREPTSYYGRNSGIGVAIQAAESRGSLRVGVIGLGAGTIAAYGRAGDRYTFYEINPLDVQIANQQFNFLRDSPASTGIVLGDARLSLERGVSQGFDVLAVDAFSGDSIPVHLLTREAFELYFRELKPDGVLAVHVSNNYLNLEPVVRSAAASLNKEAVLVSNSDDHPNGIYAATWILVGANSAFATKPQMEEAGRVLPSMNRGNLWTDDYSSLFPLLK
jgi:hypothetical protein